MVKILKGVRIKGTGILGRITGKITSKIHRAFGFKGKAPKPGPNARVIGHGGIAAGDLKERQRRAEAFYAGSGEAVYSAEEIARWRNLSGDVVQGFVENEEILFVNSSNVASLQYFGGEQKLIVEFLDGTGYTYSGVTHSEALQFATAQSKGGTVWDLLRVRGSRTAHKKPFAKLSGRSQIPRPPKLQQPPTDLPPFEQFL